MNNRFVAFSAASLMAVAYVLTTDATQAPEEWAAVGSSRFDVADRLAIENVIANMLVNLDKYDVEAWSGAFSDDATLAVVDADDRFVLSKSQFVQGMKDRYRQFQANKMQRRHVMSNIAFLSQTADSAHIKCSGVLLSTQDSAKTELVSTLFVEGQLVKQDGYWKIHSWTVGNDAKMDTRKAVQSYGILPSEITQGQLTSELVPGTIPYRVLLPGGYDQETEPLPLLLLLHGGGGSCEDLDWWKPVFDELWDAGKLPKLVVAMASVGEREIERRARYMDFRDGSEKWESFVITDFLSHLRGQFPISDEPNKTLIAGISDGGFGALRIAFKHPETFAGVVGFEPAILPALRWNDVMPRNHFFISKDVLTRYYGNPIDEAYWAANNPATIAHTNADRIRRSGLAVYLECGDNDYLNLHEGTEFLHQVLWNAGIEHEYHLVRGADHLGGSLPERMKEGVAFLQRVLNPPDDDSNQELQQMIDYFRTVKEPAERESPRRVRSGENQD